MVFNVNMSNSSAISWRDRLQFVKLMMMAVSTKICLIFIVLTH